MENIDIIKEKLIALGEDYDCLKPNMQKRLQEVEDLLQVKQNERLEAIDVLKNIGLNLSAISKDLNISRTTLYNHEQLLKRYIDASIETLSKEDPIVEISKLRTQIADYKDQIQQLMYRDLDMEILKHKNNQLNDTIKAKNEEIARLNRRIIQLQSSK